MKVTSTHTRTATLRKGSKFTGSSGAVWIVTKVTPEHVKATCVRGGEIYGTKWSVGDHHAHSVGVFSPEFQATHGPITVHN